jgi:hypothetical protein
MIDWVNSPAEILTVLSIAAMILAALVWLIKAVQSVQHETKPNSGTSMRDAIDRIERTVDKLNDKLDGHIDWHMDREK